MSWWGKIAGGAFGFMLGGPLGALIGATIGHQFDSGVKTLDTGGGWVPGDQERVQTAFFTATFSVMGHVAKADGHVSRDEIRAAEQVMTSMNLSGDMRKAAVELFNKGKQDAFPLDDVLRQFRRECHRRNTLIRLFIEIQLQAAFADGVLHPKERDLLRRICRHLGISDRDFEALLGAAGAEQHHGGAQGSGRMSLDDAYAILEVSPQASDREVKKAYRLLMSRHHPDKLVAKGLPEEMMKIATEKTQEIRAAYDLVKKRRG
jgi:DnaJ like chaperone protein